MALSKHLFRAEWRADLRRTITETEKSARWLLEEFSGEMLDSSLEVERIGELC